MDARQAGVELAGRRVIAEVLLLAVMLVLTSACFDEAPPAKPAPSVGASAPPRSSGAARAPAPAPPSAPAPTAVGACLERGMNARRAEVIAAVQAVVGDAKPQVPAAIAQLYPYIDDGTLPRMVGDLRTISRIALSTPERVRALALIADALRPLGAEAPSLLAALLDRPDLPELLTALSRLLKADDGRLVRSALGLIASFAGELARTVVLDSGASPAAEAARRALVDELLRELPGVALGAPVVIDRLDASGKPLAGSTVRTDPFPTYAKSEPYGPAPVPTSVVDHPGGGMFGGIFDGLDWDSPAVRELLDKGAVAAGRLLNGGGQTYAEEVLDRDVQTRDAPDRARNLSPRIELHRTVLAALLAMGGDAIREGLHADLATILEVALGEREGEGFRADNPIAALHHGLLELLTYPAAPKLLDALAMTLETDPELGEALVAKLLRVAKLLAATDLALPDVPAAEADALLRANLALADQLFRTPANGTSSARAVMRALAQLGAQAQGLPKAFAAMVKYRRIVRGDDGDLDMIDQAASELVDRTRPPTYVDSATGATVDNRSCLERLAALDRAADRCKIPVINKRLGLVHHEIMAELTPATAVMVGDLMAKALSIDSRLAHLVCEDLDKHVRALVELSTSGALDGLIPVLKVFKRTGQLELFLEMLLLANDHYDQIRPLEPMIVAILESGAVESGLELVALMNQIELPGTDEVVADVLADACAFQLDHTAPVRDIAGRSRPARAYLVVEPLQQLFRALSADERARAAVTHLIDTSVDLVAKVSRSDGGTPGDTSDDFDALANPLVVPLAARVLSLTAATLPQDPAARERQIEEAQAALPAVYTHRAMGELVGGLVAYRDNPHRAELDRLVAGFLTPGTVAAPGAYAQILRLLGALLQHQAALDARAMKALLELASELLDPRLGLIKHAVDGLTALLSAGDPGMILGMLRRMITAGHPRLGGHSPLSLMLEIASSCSGGSGRISEADVLGWGVLVERFVDVMDTMFSLVLSREGGPGGQLKPLQFAEGTYEWAVQHSRGAGGAAGKAERYRLSPLRR